MEYLVTAEEMRRADSAAIERIGIPAIVLMERAAYSVWEEIHLRNPAGGGTVLILSGCGNNGADGLALGRILSENGYEVELILCGKQEKATEQWKQQYRILQNYPVRIVSKPQSEEYTILIDALFGVGLSREIQGEYAQRIGEFNALHGWKIALDVPSGIHSDNGHIMGCCVRADLTVTFAFPKRGLYEYPGADYSGEIVVKDIGIGERCFYGEMPGTFRYTELPAAILPARRKDGNKGTFGKVLLAAGNEQMAGAAVLAAYGAARIGAGMVRVITPENNRGIVLSRMPEALIGTKEDMQKGLEWADAIAIGPGLGTGTYGRELLAQVLEESRLPLVIDADALNLLAQDERLQQSMAQQGAEGRTVVLTPHMGELSRLTGRGIPELQENREQFVKGLAQKWNCVIVSKDARTLICRGKGASCLNTNGNSGMATAGSGDVLTGIIAGLLAQGVEGFAAAAAGVYLHGAAGDAAAEQMGEHAVMAWDIAQALTQLR